jgi:uncharacterized protein (TIGR03000 family)
MFRNTLSTLSLAALTAAVCLWTATPANAQRRGGGGGRGGGRAASSFRGGNFADSNFRGFENWGFSRGFYGGYFPGYGYGWGGYPGYYYGSPYYYGYAPSYYYSSPSYYGYAPSYYYMPDAYTVAPSTVLSTSAYPPSGETQVHIQLTVPENAEVWFDDTKTTQTGRERDYTTSNLTPGREYSYNLHVRWRDANGQMVEKEKKVSFRPGDNLRFDFTPNAS